MKHITVRKQKNSQNLSLCSAFSRKHSSLQVNSCCTLPCGIKTQRLNKCDLAEESTEAPTSLHILRHSNHLCFIRRLLSWFWHSHGVTVTAALLWTVQAACERPVVDCQYEQQWGWYPDTVHSTVRLCRCSGEAKNVRETIYYMSLFGTLRFDQKILIQTKTNVETNVYVSRLHNSTTAAERFYQPERFTQMAVCN